MNEKTLRSEPIRLASENPDLRGDLLPLLGKSGSGPLSPEALANDREAVKDLHDSFHAVDNVLALAKKYSHDAAYVQYSDDLDSMFQGIRGQKTMDEMEHYLDALSKLDKVLQGLVTSWARVKSRYRRSATTFPG